MSQSSSPTGGLTHGPVAPLVWKVAMPAMVGYLFHTMFNVVDTFWAGQISTRALAALSLSFPLFFIIMSVSSGLATGATALIGQALGAEDSPKAHLYTAQALGFGLCAGVLVAVAAQPLLPWLFGLLGAEGGYLDDCLLYARPIFWGTPLSVGVFMLSGVLNALGDTRPYRDYLVAGSLLNLGLDPWFIHGGFGLPAMGIAGVAYATLLVQGGGCVYMAWRTARAGFLDRRTLALSRPHPHYYLELAHQGVPASLNVATIGLGIFVITGWVALWGQEAVAGYNVATRIEQIVLLPSMALNIATLAMTAQNAGAGRFDRVREARNVCLKAGAWIMAAGGLVLLLAGRPLMGLFSDDPAVLEAGAGYLRVAAFALYSYVVLFTCVAVMQGLKRPMFAVWIGVIRQMVAPVAVFWLLTEVVHAPLTAIWWAIFGVVWSAAAFSWFYVCGVLRRIENERGAQAPAPEAAPRGP